MPEAEPIDHIGLDLWRASQNWKRRFVEGMVSRGYKWFGEARANLVHLIGPDGSRQGDLAAESQLTKQAVQQFLDELEADGIVKRHADPRDARLRIVRFTEKGRRLIADAGEVKRQIESDYIRLLGAPKLRQLRTALHRIGNFRHGAP